jgi:cytidylate kinase
MAQKLHIAIDGPVAAGKGTVASLVAKKLGILYVESGAMYRTVALLGMHNNVDLTDEGALLNLLGSHTITLEASSNKPGECSVFLDSKNVTDSIRTPEVSNGSSIVAKHPGIRSYLVKKQQVIAENNSVVMEGRDIGSIVLPHAQIKVFLTADSGERAKRRQGQLAQKGIIQSYEEIEKETQKRDEQDMNREINPLRVVPGATVIDTTNLSIDEVVTKIVNLTKNT